VTARFPATAAPGRAFRVAGTVRSSAGAPRGTCALERMAAGRWARIAAAPVTAARRCSLRVVLRRAGSTARLRVRFRPAGGWLASVSPAAAVRIRPAARVSAGVSKPRGRAAASARAVLGWSLLSAPAPPPGHASGKASRSLATSSR
jgi:hypothetical protein